MCRWRLFIHLLPTAELVPPLRNWRTSTSGLPSFVGELNFFVLRPVHQSPVAAVTPTRRSPILLVPRSKTTSAASFSRLEPRWPTSRLPTLMWELPRRRQRLPVPLARTRTLSSSRTLRSSGRSRVRMAVCAHSPIWVCRLDSGSARLPAGAFRRHHGGYCCRHVSLAAAGVGKLPCSPAPSSGGQGPRPPELPRQARLILMSSSFGLFPKVI